MEQYMGFKLIEAEPAYWCNGVVYPMSEGQPNSSVLDGRSDVEAGYRVRYPDGYTSWSPKDVFEKAYMKVVPNPNLKTTRPSISQAMVDDFIMSKDVITIGNKTTVVHVVCRNGFEFVESSSCVSAENYNETLGAEICMTKIKDKIWSYLGFLLQTAVFGINGTDFCGLTDFDPVSEV